jgi:hypothetical protein
LSLITIGSLALAALSERFHINWTRHLPSSAIVAEARWGSESMRPAATSNFGHGAADTIGDNTDNEIVEP